MVEILFVKANRAEHYTELYSIGQASHAFLSEIFFLDKMHSFCFTPTTHALLQLPDMLRECGHLTVPSKFAIERLVGK